MIELCIIQHIAYVTLSRPEKQNALSFDMFIALDKTIKQLKKDKSIRAVILQGAGDHFSSGLDVKSVMAKPSNIFKLLFKWLPGNANLVQRVVLGWQTLPVPVIAVIEGNCFGGGLHIALGADFRIASPHSKLAIMESRWGLCPDMGSSTLLSGLTRYDQVTLLTMQGEPINADTALNFGLISEVSHTPLEEAQNKVAQLLTRSPDALAAIKRVNQQSFTHSSRKILAKETWSQIKLLLSKNTKRAMFNALNEDKKAFVARKKW